MSARIRVARLAVVLAAAGLLLRVVTAQSTTAAKPFAPPRTADGQPDLQGMWSGQQLTIEPGYDNNIGTGAEGGFFPTGRLLQLEPGAAPPSAPKPRSAAPAPMLRADTPDGRIPYLPWARDKKEFNFKTIYSPTGAASLDDIDPVARCLPAGVPRSSYWSTSGAAYQVLQVPGYVVFLDEWNHLYRSIPLDGRPHVGSSLRLWMGDSRGHWEGNTLVIETANMNGKAWLDHMGSIHTDSLKVTERYIPIDAGRIDYEITLDDPKAFSRPWRLLGHWDRVTEPDWELLEYACHEGNGRAMESLTPKTTK